MKPYQQGYLDGLCGAYAVINAVRLVSKNLTTEEKIRAFRKEINQIASAYTNPDDVYQMNIQLFALTTGDIP